MKKAILINLAIVAWLFATASILPAQTSKEQGSIYMSLMGGSIVKIDLADWSVKYLLERSSRDDGGARMKYFPCCRKIVTVGGDHYQGEDIGIIDLQTDNFEYIDPVASGLEKYIRNILLSKTDENILYLTTDSHPHDASRNNAVYGKYDAVTGTIEKIKRPKGDMKFYSDWDWVQINFSNPSKSVSFYGGTAKPFITVEEIKNGDSTVISSSPKDFLKKWPDLVSYNYAIITD